MAPVADEIPQGSAQVGLFIPVRNGEAYLEQCITSMLRQTFQDWHLTIQDNRSTDGTRQIVERFASDPRISYACNELDLGAIGNFNRCLDKVETEFYAILSHDDFFREPDVLEMALEAMRCHPEVGVVYSDLEWVDASGLKITEKRMPFRGRVAGLELARQCLLAARNHFGVPILLRRTSVEGLRYDPAFPLTCDIDFSMACLARTPAFCLPSPGVAIRFHPGNGTMRAYWDAGAEYMALSRKHQVSLDLLDRLRSRLNNALNLCKKRAFFFYLDHVRGRFRPVSSWIPFILVGAFNTILGIALYGLLLRLGLPFPVATALSLALGIAVGFQAHRRLVFRREGMFLRYVAVWLVIYVLANLLIWVFQRWFGTFIAGVVATPLNAAAAFLGLKRFVFIEPASGDPAARPSDGAA